MTARWRRPLEAWRRLRPWVWPGLALLGFAYAMTHAHLDPGQMGRLFTRVNLVSYGAALLVFYLASVLRAGRFRMLLRNAGQRTALATDWKAIMTGWLINGLIPAKTGDLYRAQAIGRAYPISVSRTLGTIAVERLVDFAVLLLLIDGFAVLLFRGSPPPPFLGIFIAIAVLASSILGALLASRHLGWSVMGRLPQRVRGPVARFRAGFQDAPGNLPLLVGTTAALWLFESARLYLVLHALPLPALSLTQVSLVALVGSALTGAPGLPGGVALVEGGIIAVLMYFGFSATAALFVALLDRAINYWSVLLLGACVVLAGQIVDRLAHPRRPALAPVPVLETRAAV
ncbi:MAG TPA: lysylphosphatidylglycerol synthase transmembrane domain-containing protein [Candidatus Limnocylindrales bacterium]|nr:lysylphosphatidylglycerol synthase transmembrane domain-containing protein [Candidatus Limnocylindrales bacterium]